MAGYGHNEESEEMREARCELSAQRHEGMKQTEIKPKPVGLILEGFTFFQICMAAGDLWSFADAGNPKQYLSTCHRCVQTHNEFQRLKRPSTQTLLLLFLLSCVGISPFCAS